MVANDDEQDDWAPLAEDRLWARPGEVEPEPEPAAAKPSIEWEQPACTPEEVDRREQELKQRFAEPLPGNSLWGKLERRERRQQRVTERSAELQQAFGTCDAPSTVAAPVVEYDEGTDGRDEREESEWFQRLPEQEQHRLRDAWAHKRDITSANSATEKKNGNRRLVAAWICFAAALVAGSGMLWHATLGAGVVCGFWWRHTAPDRFLDPVRAIVCLFALQALVMIVWGVQNPMLFMDSVFVIAFSALAGFDGEIRRTGGFDAPNHGAPK